MDDLKKQGRRGGTMCDLLLFVKVFVFWRVDCRMFSVEEVEGFVLHRGNGRRVEVVELMRLKIWGGGGVAWGNRGLLYGITSSFILRNELS